MPAPDIPNMIDCSIYSLHPILPSNVWLVEELFRYADYTDAQINSNMGMVLASVHQYREAFSALQKAQSLDLNNPNIEKELLWLHNNQGLDDTETNI